MTLAALLALLSSALYGTSDFLSGAMSRRLPGPAVAFWSQLAGGAALLVLVVLSGQGFSGPGAAWGAAAGIIVAAGVLLFYRALALGTTSIVTSIAASGVALPVAWGIAVGGETPSPVGVVGILVVVVGLASLSVAGSSGKQVLAVEPPCPPARTPARTVAGTGLVGQGPPRLAVPLALASAACFGAFFILLDRGTAVAGGGVLWVSVGVEVGALVTTVGFAALSGLRETVWVGSPRLLLPVAAIGLLELCADVALIYATVLGQLSVVSVLASLSVLVTAVLARFLLGDRLSRLGMAGVALSLIGVVLISA